MNKLIKLASAVLIILLVACSGSKGQEEAVAAVSEAKETFCTVYVRDVFDGEEETLVADQEVAYGKTYVIPDLEASGYELFSITGSDGKAFKAGEEVTMTGDLTLAFSWTSV